METLAIRHPPWPELPCNLLESILERLPLSDYVRFSAVCRRWRSVQSSHRRLRSPSPPSMLRLPWRISTKRCRGKTLSCYSPFEGRTFSFPLPSLSPLYLHSASRGWFLAYHSGNFPLWNPISGGRMLDLPRWIYNRPLKSTGIAAVSPPPNYIVSVIDFSTIFLLRWFDSGWTELKLPTPLQSLKQAVSIGGKHYRICSEGPYPYDLLVVDALATPPSFNYFGMSRLSEMPIETGRRYGTARFLDSDGEPLLVKEIVKFEGGGNSWREITVGFEVFRADLGTKMWMKVESIGDRVIILHRFQSLSLLPTEVGGRGNCIYFRRLRCQVNNVHALWRAFDLGTGRFSDLLLLNASQIMKHSQLLFVPSLYMLILELRFEIPLIG